MLIGLNPVDVHHQHPFGCLAWYKVPEPDHTKLNPKARKACLLSYLQQGNGYVALFWILKPKKLSALAMPCLMIFSFPCSIPHLSYRLNLSMSTFPLNYLHHLIHVHQPRNQLLQRHHRPRSIASELQLDVEPHLIILARGLQLLLLINQLSPNPKPGSRYLKLRIRKNT